MLIPKRVFFFWGNPVMSWMRYMTLKSFRFLNPDWHMILYMANSPVTERPWEDHNKQDFFAYKGKNYIDKVKELDIEILGWSMQDYPEMAPSHMSNFLKWHKLDAHGGVYSDLDILWLKPLDDFIAEIGDNDTVLCYRDYLSIGLLASKITNPFYRDLFENAKKTYTPKRYQCVGVENIYRMLYGVEVNKPDGDILWSAVYKHDVWADLQARYPTLRFHNIPMALVYPFTHDKMASVFEAVLELPEHTIGLHWYAGNPLAQRYNALLNHENFKVHECTFTELARRYA